MEPPLNIFITNFLLVLLLVLQLVMQPFRAKWKNIVDTMFLLNLVLLFLGSMYFWSTDSSLDRSVVSQGGLAYSTTFIVLGFLLMLGIVAYLVILRFSKLQKIVGRLLNKIPWIDVSDTELSKESRPPIGELSHFVEVPDANTVTIDSSKRPSDSQSSSCITASELREPLLEYGYADVCEVDPSTIPTREQTSFKN